MDLNLLLTIYLGLYTIVSENSNTIKEYVEKTVIMNETAVAKEEDERYEGKNKSWHYNATIGQIPYQASIQDKFYQHLCGATIIGKKTLLTAAHCPYAEETYYARAGFIALSGRNGQYRRIDKILCHPQFNFTTLLNDIALLITYDEFTFNRYVGPIKYAKKRPVVSDECVVSGWGSIKPTRDEYSDTLMALRMIIQTPADCKYTVFNLEKMLCVGGKLGHGTCSGDSGGPLVCDSQLSGIISFSTTFCGAGEPDVMTDVSYYYEYIKENFKIEYRINNAAAWKHRNKKNSLIYIVPLLGIIYTS